MANWRHALIITICPSFVWNLWRGLNPTVRPDLAAVWLNFGGLLRYNNLNHVNLRGARLSHSNLFQGNCSFSDLTGADLSWARLEQADLRGSDLSGATLVGADCTGANFTGANLSGTDLRACNMLRADLSDAIVEGALIEDFKAVNPRGFPKIPKRLRLREDGSQLLTGPEAARFFQCLAVVQIVVSGAFDESEEWAYRSIPIFMHKAGVGSDVTLSKVVPQGSHTVLEFEAQTYEAIYAIVPPLLAAFPSSHAIQFHTLLTALRESETRDDKIKNLDCSLTTAIVNSLSRAYEITAGMESFRKALVTEIREPNRERKLDVYRDHTDHAKAHQIINNVYFGPVTIENRGDVITGSQSVIEQRDTIVAVGENSRASADKNASNFQDAEALANELALLIQAMKNEAKDPSHFESMLCVKNAEEAARSGEWAKALDFLKTAGLWTWDVATKVGIGVATAAAKEKLGI